MTESIFLCFSLVRIGDCSVGIQVRVTDKTGVGIWDLRFEIRVTWLVQSHTVFTCAYGPSTQSLPEDRVLPSRSDGGQALNLICLRSIFAFHHVCITDDDLAWYQTSATAIMTSERADTFPKAAWLAPEGFHAQHF